jgi:hypothetical protein
MDVGRAFEDGHTVLDREVGRDRILHAIERAARGSAAAVAPRSANRRACAMASAEGFCNRATCRTLCSRPASNLDAPHAQRPIDQHDPQ